MGQQPRQDDPAAASHQMRDVLRQPDKRPGEDVGEDEIIRRPRADRGVIGARSVEEFQGPARTVVAGVFAGDPDRFRVEIRCDRGGRANLQGGDRQNAGAGSDVEHAANAPGSGETGEGFKASLGGAVVSGSEGRPSLDPDRNAAGPGRIPVWIEAGPAFGTGHHGTTKGCLEALARLARTRRVGRVLDIGTGSGVLAIAALKIGATSAIATDLDAESVRVARENARNNRSGRTLKFLHASGANHAAIRAGAPYDLILANILARPLVWLSQDISHLVRRGGRVILSGLLTHQEPQVRRAYLGQGLVLVDRLRITGWSTLVFERPARAKRRGCASGPAGVRLQVEAKDER